MPRSHDAKSFLNLDPHSPRPLLLGGRDIVVVGPPLFRACSGLSSELSSGEVRVMHQHAGRRNIVHVLDVNFKIEDRLGGFPGHDGLNGQELIVRRANALAGPERAGFDEGLAVFAPEWVVGRAADGLVETVDRNVDHIGR